MRKTALLFLAVLLISGCGGKPRYGGGLHTDEGNYKPEEKPKETVSSAVDPIAMGRIIDRYLGRPYAGKGETVKGYDCSEFVCAVYEEYASVHLPRTTENLFRAGRRIEPEQLTFGDLVFFDTGGRGVSHVGIYVGFDEFVHASTTNGIIISSLGETYYSKRYMGARRVME